MPMLCPPLAGDFFVRYDLCASVWRVTSEKTMATKHEYEITIRPYGARGGVVEISPKTLYGYWEHQDGSEGGNFWFVRSGNGQLELTDFDGARDLPKAVYSALARAGVNLDSASGLDE